MLVRCPLPVKVVSLLAVTIAVIVLLCGSSNVIPSVSASSVHDLQATATAGQASCIQIGEYYDAATGLCVPFGGGETVVPANPYQTPGPTDYSCSAPDGPVTPCPTPTPPPPTPTACGFSLFGGPIACTATPTVTPVPGTSTQTPTPTPTGVLPDCAVPGNLISDCFFQGPHTYWTQGSFTNLCPANTYLHAAQSFGVSPRCMAYEQFDGDYVSQHIPSVVAGSVIDIQFFTELVYHGGYHTGYNAEVHVSSSGNTTSTLDNGQLWSYAFTQPGSGYSDQYFDSGPITLPSSASGNYYLMFLNHSYPVDGGGASVLFDNSYVQVYCLSGCSGVASTQTPTVTGVPTVTQTPTPGPSSTPYPPTYTATPGPSSTPTQTGTATVTGTPVVWPTEPSAPTPVAYCDWFCTITSAGGDMFIPSHVSTGPIATAVVSKFGSENYNALATEMPQPPTSACGQRLAIQLPGGFESVQAVATSQPVSYTWYLCPAQERNVALAQLDGYIPGGRIFVLFSLLILALAFQLSGLRNAIAGLADPTTVTETIHESTTSRGGGMSHTSSSTRSGRRIGRIR